LSSRALAELPGARRGDGAARAGRQICGPGARRPARAHISDLDIEDSERAERRSLIERARAVEAAAMAVPASPIPKAAARASGAAIALATSEGFFGRYAGTSHSIGVAVLAAKAPAWSATTTAPARAMRPISKPPRVGRRAGERTVAASIRAR
jgi:PmbA protein